MAKRKQFKPGFRHNNSPKSKGHPTYVYGESGNEYKYLGITHSSKSGHKKNYELLNNPNPNDTRKAYVRKQAQKDKKHFFGKLLQSGSFSEKDSKNIKKYMK